MNFVWPLFADFKVEFVEWLHIFCKHVYMQTCVNTVNVYRFREAIPVNSVLLFFSDSFSTLYAQVCLCKRLCGQVLMHLQKNIVSQPHNDASAHSEHLFVILGHKCSKKRKERTKGKKKRRMLE